MGDRTIEDVLRESSGATIEDILGHEDMSVSLQPGVPMVTPQLDKRPIAQEPKPAPTEALSGPLMTRAQQRQMLLEGSLMGLGGLGGGIAGRAYLGGALTRPVGAAIGEGVGTALGGRVAGMPEDEAIKAGLLAGGLGGSIETGMNVGSRVIGSVTTTPESTISETLKLPTRQQADVMFRSPKGMPERAIGLKTLQKIAKARAQISPGRLTKSNIITAADRAKVQVPIQDLEKAIDVGIADASMAVGRANTTAAANLESLKVRLAKKFPSGNLTASEADAQLRAFQRDADMAAARNNPFLAQTFRGLKDSLRQSFFSTVDTTLPGSNIAKATADARRYLESVDTLEQFVKDKTPETFVRSLFGGEQDAQSAMAALREFEKQTGTKGAIEAEIKHLALKRAWTQEETGRAFSLWRAIEKVIAKPLTKGMIIGGRPAGQAAAAIPAFMQAMKQPQENP